MATDAQALLLQVSSDTSKAIKNLDNLQKKLSGVADAAEASSARGQSALSKFFGKTDPGAAVDKIFDSSRLKILDTGVARIGLVGSAFEDLGAAGLIAAAGVAATAIALKEAGDAIAYADSLQKVADKLHVTTDALQEYRYAARVTGGDEQGADQALEAFSDTLGKAQAGLVKSQKGFLELGFTKDQIKSFTDVDTALKAVTDKISGLAKPQQKDAVVDQLGLTGLKPLIEGGTEEMTRLRAEAEKLGIVMDSTLVKNGAQLHDQFETLNEVIKVQLMNAFIDLGPVLVGLLGVLAQMATKAADIADAFKDIENKRTKSLEAELAKLEGQDKGAPKPTPEAGLIGNLVDKLLPFAKGAAASLGSPDERQDREVEIKDELEARKMQGSGTKPPGGGQLKDLTGDAEAKAAAAKAARVAAESASQEKEREDRSEQVVDASDKEEIAARTALVTNIQDLAQSKRDEVDADLKAKIDKLSEEESQHKITSAAADEAEAADKAAALAKKTLIDRQEHDDLLKATNAILETQLQSQIDQLTIADSLALTADEHRKNQLALLDLDEKLQTIKLQEIIDSQTASDNDKALAAAQLTALRALHGSKVAQVTAGTRGPGEDYLNSVNQDLADSGQKEAVDNLKALSDGLTDILDGTKSVKQAFHDMAQSIVADLIRIGVEREITLPLANALFGPAATGGSSSGGGLGTILAAAASILPHFASGTNFAPGGLSLVGERGPELVNLPTGSQVLPSNLLSNLANISVSRAQASGPSSLSVSIDLTGANGDAAIEAAVNRGVYQAVNASLRLASAAIPAQIAKQNSRVFR